jgi:hypothetical protein
VLIAVYCQATEEPYISQHYRSDKYGFSMDIPSDWELYEDVMGPAFAAYSQQESPRDDFQENVNVIIKQLPRAMSPREYHRETLPVTEQALPGFKVVSEGPEAIGGRDAWKVISQNTIEGRQHTVLAYIVTNERRVYIISCAAISASYPRWERTFTNIAQSFRVQSPGARRFRGGEIGAVVLGCFLLFWLSKLVLRAVKRSRAGLTK